MKSSGGLQRRKTRKKWAYLSFEAGEKEIRVRIKDQGAGFDWRKYLEISPERATDPHGRGIATSKMMSFTSVDYIGCGNEVVCSVALGNRDAVDLAQPATAAARGIPELANS